jgi:hypothetical protein
MDIESTDLPPTALALLWAARETGALDALVTDADTPAEVAAAAGIDERAATLLVESLAALDFLEPVGDAHEPTNRMLGFLASADLRSVGNLPAALTTLDALTDLPAAMADGEGLADADATARLGARAAMDEATVRAVAGALARAAPDAGTAVVAHGAPGTYARSLADLGVAVTVAAPPADAERAGPLLAPTDVDLAAVDPADPLPAADLVVAVDALRRRPPAERTAFVERLAAAAAPGGTVAVAERLWTGDAGDVAPAVTAFARDGGGLPDETAVRTAFDGAGLAGVTVEGIPGTGRSLVSGHADG